MFCLLSYDVGDFSCASVFDLLTPVIFKITCSDLVCFPKFFRLKALFDLIVLGLCFSAYLPYFMAFQRQKMFGFLEIQVAFVANFQCFYTCEAKCISTKFIFVPA